MTNFLVFFFFQASDFTDMEDWPTLGQTFSVSERRQTLPVTNGEAKQNGAAERICNQEDSDGSQSSQVNNHDQRAKKGKWFSNRMGVHEIFELLPRPSRTT